MTLYKSVVLCLLPRVFEICPIFMRKKICFSVFCFMSCIVIFFKISPQAGGSDVERTKKKRRGDRYSVQTSLIVAALKKMLPIGLNMCSPADHELINLAKFRYSLVQSPQKPDSSPVVMFLCVPSVCRMRSVSVTVYCSVSALPTICVLLCVKPALS